ncbi:unnamed protein product [Phaedon cochleariae]|uniref:Cuticle protein n=1 Tax=Phaedon cochleariae TaxID=80249 RepID=A0A9N9X3R4_PHACE|nr:unnamed protein product [Phaedon cochleariae]
MHVFVSPISESKSAPIKNPHLGQSKAFIYKANRSPENYQNPFNNQRNMAFKFVVFAALAAVASAGVLPVSYSSAPSVSYSSVSSPLVAPQLSHGAQLSYAAPALKIAAPAVRVAAPVHYAAPVSHAVLAEHSAPAQYDFGYAINDPHTGDNHNQQESRRGDAVQGSYSLIEADGSRRTVEYTADDHSGFNAVVHNEPAAVHVKAVAPVAHAVVAPVSHGYAAPLSHGYAAPLSHGYAAPLSHGYAAPAYYH